MSQTMRAVKLLAAYGSNNAGEVCGFPESVARKLLDRGLAVDPNASPVEKTIPKAVAVPRQVVTRDVMINPTQEEIDEAVAPAELPKAVEAPKASKAPAVDADAPAESKPKTRRRRRSRSKE
jgi:hypothetical protein